MFRYAVLGIIGLAGNAWAQQASPQAEAPAALSSPAALQSSAAISMEEPLPGDHWTYEVRDEIIGTISATRQNIVTDVTPTQVNTRVETVGKPNAGNIVFDRSWNMTVSGPGNSPPTTVREFNCPFRSARPGIFNATKSMLPTPISGSEQANRRSSDGRA